MVVRVVSVIVGVIVVIDVIINVVLVVVVILVVVVVVGVVVGTYSSIFVASPALLWMMNPDSLFNRLVGSAPGGSNVPSRQATATES